MNTIVELKNILKNLLNRVSAYTSAKPYISKKPTQETEESLSIFFQC